MCEKASAALHFLVGWISRLIALWFQGFNIPSLDFFFWEELDQFLRSLANEGPFFYNVHGILCLKKIVVVNEGVIVLDICTKLKGSPDSTAGSTLF